MIAMLRGYPVLVGAAEGTWSIVAKLGVLGTGLAVAMNMQIYH